MHKVSSDAVAVQHCMEASAQCKSVIITSVLLLSAVVDVQSNIARYDAINASKPDLLVTAAGVCMY